MFRNTDFLAIGQSHRAHSNATTSEKEGPLATGCLYSHIHSTRSLWTPLCPAQPLPTGWPRLDDQTDDSSLRGQVKLLPARFHVVGTGQLQHQRVGGRQ